MTSTNIKNTNLEIILLEFKNSLLAPPKSVGDANPEVIRLVAFEIVSEIPACAPEICSAIGLFKSILYNYWINKVYHKGITFKGLLSFNIATLTLYLFTRLANPFLEPLPSMYKFQAV